MTETQILELDSLEGEGGDDNVDRILDLMTEVGADAEGLRILVERYGTSANHRIRGNVAMVLSRACWVWGFEDERLPHLVFEFTEMTLSIATDETLSTTLNAVFGLGSRRILRRGHEDDRGVLGRLLTQCISRDDWDVRSTALYVLTHMHSDGILHGLLIAQDSTALKDALRTMTVDPEDLEYWEALRAFWATA